MGMDKFGYGTLLISQIMDDFMSEIEVNISTEIQMGTSMMQILNE